MIRILQRKFVVTAMIATTVLISLILGVINVNNLLSVRKEIYRTLELLSENEGKAENLLPQPEAPPAGFFGEGPKNDYDTIISSNFLMVRMDQEGEVTFVDISRTSSVTEEEAVQLAEEILEKGEERGKTGKFYYLLKEASGGKETVLICLDASQESFSYIRLLLLSGLVGIACWGVMLGVLIILSKRAVRPIADNIEKQKQFVANAGHEIKTPIAIIQSNVEAMELYQGASKWSTHIKEQTIRLNGLMKNLLLLAQMDEGAVKKGEEEFLLENVLRQTLEQFQEDIQEKNIQLHEQLQSNVVFCAEKSHIEQLLFILLENAVKYTQEQGNIWLYLQKEENQIRLKLQNTCEEVPKVSPDKLFDRFYRADFSRSREQGGYGIGLSIARELVQLYQGEVEVEYLRSDRMCFTVSFKLE